MLFNKTIRPARGLVLTVEIEPPTATPTGLQLPRNVAGRGQRVSAEDAERAASFVAAVVAIGPPPLNDAGQEVPTDGLAVGQTVLVRMGYGATIHVIDGVTHFLVPFGAIGGRIVPVTEPETDPDTVATL